MTNELKEAVTRLEEKVDNVLKRVVLGNCAEIRCPTCGKVNPVNNHIFSSAQSTILCEECRGLIHVLVNKSGFSIYQIWYYWKIYPESITPKEAAKAFDRHISEISEDSEAVEAEMSYLQAVSGLFGINPPEPYYTRLDSIMADKERPQVCPRCGGELAEELYREGHWFCSKTQACGYGWIDGKGESSIPENGYG
jgi:ssDNA-binding Zn-finger/Zn-ribbon topoisomerase 1